MHEWINSIVALSGLALALIGLVRQMRQDQKSVKITLSNAMHTRAAPGRDRALSITVVNTGRRPVKIVSAGFRTNQRRELQSVPIDFFGQTPLPKVLSEGEDVTIYHGYDQFVLEFGPSSSEHAVSMFARDAEGKNYTEDLPDWLEEQIIESATNLRRTGIQQ